MIARPAAAKTRIIYLLLCVSLLFLCEANGDAQQQRVPHLRKQGTATQLIVDDKPFLVLAGELGNSSSSGLEYMRPVWPKLAALKLNTVLIPVYWELIEPVEGKFDFTLVDGLIQDARKQNLHLVPLWFASWKNSMSCYAPSWVKTDQVKPSRWKVRVSASPRKNSQASQRRANVPLPPGSTRSEPEIMDFPRADSECLSISVLRSLPRITGELAP